MKPDLHVGLAQIDIVSLDPVANLALVEETIRWAGKADVDLLVLPELMNTGQVPGWDDEFAKRFFSLLEPLNGAFVRTVADLARSHGVHVVVGVAEGHPMVPHTAANSAVVIDGNGVVAGVQRKLHLPGEERHWFSAGDTIGVVRTDLGVLAVHICYDLYFPEVSRVSALAGSDILVGIANIPYRPVWSERIAQLAAVRSYENMQPVIVVNRVGTDHGAQYGGGSVAVRPPGIIDHQSPLLDSALDRVTLLGVDVMEQRARRPIFAVRRPELYGPILGPVFPANLGGEEIK